MAAKVGPQHPLIVVAGPTGSGKSALGLALAGRFQGEVVNFDSVQVYRGFDVGSAKTPFSQRLGIPHHLIDVAGASEVFTAGDFARLAGDAVREITGRGAIPILVGGTGFYLRALLQGLPVGPVRDENLREKLRRRELRSAGSLHRILRRLDSASAADIHPNDAKKVMRALEVRLLTGASRRELRTESVGLEGYRVLKVALDPPRAELYQRLERRAVRMFEEGLLEETRALLALAPADAKPFESLGYAQAKAVVEGRMNLEDAIAETTIRTRQYAKRQWTWFRREPGIQWFSGFGDDPAVACQTAELMARFLADATSLSEE